MKINLPKNLNLPKVQGLEKLPKVQGRGLTSPGIIAMQSCLSFLSLL